MSVKVPIVYHAEMVGMGWGKWVSYAEYQQLEAQLEKVRGLPEEWANNTKHMKFKGHQQARQEAWNCISDLQKALEDK